MTQQSSLPSTQLQSTWGKFPNQAVALDTKKKLEEAGIAPEKITVETENFDPPLTLEQTKAIANLKTGAIAGGILGALIGLLVSLIVTDFAHLRFAAFANFETIHYLSPLIAGVVGAAGMSLMSALSGANVPNSEQDIKDTNAITDEMLPKMYLLVVKGTEEEINLARNIITQQSGTLEASDR